MEGREEERKVREDSVTAGLTRNPGNQDQDQGCRCRRLRWVRDTGGRLWGFEDFSFFEGLIIIIFLNKLGTVDTVYVLTRRGARADGLFRAPISKVVLTTTIAAEVVVTAAVFLFLGKRSEFLGAALLGTRWFRTRWGIRVNLGRIGGVGVTNTNARKCPEVLGRTGVRGSG